MAQHSPERADTSTDSARFAMPPRDPLLRAEAHTLLSGLRADQGGARELLHTVLQRADQIAAAVNPFAIRLDERALARAEESDRRLADGTARSLEGLPVTVKDSQWMAGIPTTSGSLAVTDFVPDQTVGAVRRLEDAGAVVFAKTTTSEFCYSAVSHAPAFGVTANPHNLGRTAGGSSGGAAAQVAAWAGPVALGGDGGGSIRIPAAFCGVVGLKPTFGLVSHEPSNQGWKSLVSVGPLTRSVRDARLLLEVLAGFDPDDRHSVEFPVDEAKQSSYPGRHDLTVLVSEDLGFAPLNDDVRAAFRIAVDRLDAAGVRIVEGNPGIGTSAYTWTTIATSEARWSEAAYLEGPAPLLSPEVRGYLGFGESFTTEHYLAAQFARERIHHAYTEMFAASGASVLLTPTVGCVAFPDHLAYPETIGGSRIEEPWRDWAPFLYDANLTGMPAISVPIGCDRSGLPIGAHLIGPRGTDRRVLDLAQVLEHAVAPTSTTTTPDLPHHLATATKETRP